MIFNKDSVLLGVGFGVLIPLLFYFLQDNIIPIIVGHSFSQKSMQLFGLICNIPFFRYYLINLKYEKPGRGILFATFIYALIWVYVNKEFI